MFQITLRPQHKGRVRECDIKFQAFLNWAVDGCEWTVSHSDRFIPRERPLVVTAYEDGGSRIWSLYLLKTSQLYRNLSWGHLAPTELPRPMRIAV